MDPKKIIPFEGVDPKIEESKRRFLLGIDVGRQVPNLEDKYFLFGMDVGRHATTSPELVSNDKIETLYKNWIKHQID